MKTYLLVFVLVALCGCASGVGNSVAPNVASVVPHYAMFKLSSLTVSVTGAHFDSVQFYGGYQDPSNHSLSTSINIPYYQDSVILNLPNAQSRCGDTCGFSNDQMKGYLLIDTANRIMSGSLSTAWGVRSYNTSSASATMELRSVPFQMVNDSTFVVDTHPTMDDVPHLTSYYFHHDDGCGSDFLNDFYRLDSFDPDARLTINLIVTKPSQSH